MRRLCAVRSARATAAAAVATQTLPPHQQQQQPALVTVHRCQSGSTPSPPTKPPATKPRGIHLDWEAGISSDLKGIGHYAGSISAFMKPPSEKKAAESALKGNDGGPLPCDVPGSSAALQAAKAEYMASVAQSGKLPSPRTAADAAFTAVGAPTPRHRNSVGAGCGDAKVSHGHAHGDGHAHGSALPRRAPPAALNATPAPSQQQQPRQLRKPPSALNTEAPRKSSLPPPAKAAAAAKTATAAEPTQIRRNKEAADYYKSLPANELTKEEMWARINAAQADKDEAAGAAPIASLDVDYLKMEEELREFDLFHYRVGEIAYPDDATRRNYYAMWNLAMSLNKARWSMLEVHSQRGMKTTGAGMKLIFWKESIGAIMEKRRMDAGQFTDSHPVLRPFAKAVEDTPHMTKAFVRGFTDARLKVIQQPGNVQQLFDHFDKFYGYFFNSLLEVTNVKDEAAEHLMTHIGRATGLTTHCVMFWKKYARLGFTMLPADICADNQVNLALLKNIPLASQDRAVRKVLFDVMCIVKAEMVHAQKLAKDVPPKAWPIVMECLYANYYLGFLQRREFNVSAMFADHNVENAGFAWYRMKKRWEWERYQSIERLLDESAPIPFIGTSFAHRGSQYKMATGLGQDPEKPWEKEGLRKAQQQSS